MGRGAKGVRDKALGLSQKQQAMGSAQQGVQSQGRAALGSAVDQTSGYTPAESQGMQYSPEEAGSFGYTPDSAARLESSMVGAAAEPFAGADQAIARNVARTRNSAGAAGALAKSAQARSTAAGNAALNVNNVVEGRRQQVAQTVADQRTGVAERTAQSRMQAQNQKVAALAQQYGIDTNLLQNILGLPNQSLNTAAGTTGQSHGVQLGPFGTWG